MDSVDILNNSVVTNTSSDGSDPSHSTDSSVVEPLTLDDIKIFEAMAFDHANDIKRTGMMDWDDPAINEGIIEGALEETDSMLDNATQSCKKCK